jgi:hypothetical protein
VTDFGLALLDGTRPPRVGPGEVQQDLASVAALLLALLGAGRASEAAAMPAPPALQDALLATAGGSGASGGGNRPGSAAELAQMIRLGARTARPAVTGPVADAPTSSSSSSSSSPGPGAAPESVTIDEPSRLIQVVLAPEASDEDHRAVLQRLEGVLARGGPWRLVYDLAGLKQVDRTLVDLMLALHRQVAGRLERIGLCSPRAFVRASLLLLTGSSKALPSKVFAAPGPMLAWATTGVSS